jgi:murein peptide amidase A
MTTRVTVRTARSLPLCLGRRSWRPQSTNETRMHPAVARGSLPGLRAAPTLVRRLLVAADRAARDDSRMGRWVRWWVGCVGSVVAGLLAVTTTDARPAARCVVPGTSRTLDRLWRPDMSAPIAYAHRRTGDIASAARTSGRMYAWGYGTGLEDHQVALLVRGCARVSLAVLTMYDGAHPHGKATLKAIFARLLKRFSTAGRLRHAAGGTPATSSAVRGRRLVIGRSVRGRPIVARVLGPDAAPRKLLLVGCIHGNECAGEAILSALSRRPVPPGVQLWMVAEANPDASAAGTRQNADGVDLNRNFPYLWAPITNPIYDSGPRPASEPETRAAMRLIRRIRPALTIWYHQHMDLVDMAGGDRGVPRRYAQVSGMRAVCLGIFRGTATAWSNHILPGTTSFVVELPGGPVLPAALARHLRAIGAMERGQRIGSRTGCAA